MSTFPIFDLRIRIGGLTLLVPDDALLGELCDIARAGIHPPDQMPFMFPWTRASSPQFEWDFFRYHWRVRSELRPSAWCLELAVLQDAVPIGVQGLIGRDFQRLRQISTSSWISMPNQRKGFGTRMRAAALTLAFDHMNADVADSIAFADNHASSAVSRSLGYQENGRERLVREGVVAEAVRYRLTRAAWSPPEELRALVSGFESCRGLLGV